VDDVPHVGEMDPAFQRRDDGGNLVGRIGAERAGAQCYAVVDRVDRLQHPLQIWSVRDDARKAEYGPARIVRMDSHVDAVFFAHGHDGLEEVHEVGEQLFVVDFLVHREQILDARHALGLPAGKGEAVRVGVDLVEHGHRIDLFDQFLVVGKHRGSVASGLRQVRAGPVEYGHEVVADHADIFLAEHCEGLDVVVDVSVPFGKSRLDGVVDVDAFDTRDLEAVFRRVGLEGADALLFPQVARLLVVERGDDSRNPGNLADMLERNAVEAGSEPSECHLHFILLLDWHTNILAYKSGLSRRNTEKLYNNGTMFQKHGIIETEEHT